MAQYLDTVLSAQWQHSRECSLSLGKFYGFTFFKIEYLFNCFSSSFFTTHCWVSWVFQDQLFVKSIVIRRSFLGSFPGFTPHILLHLCCLRAVFYKCGSSMGFFFQLWDFFGAFLPLLILWTCVDPGGLLPWGNIHSCHGIQLCSSGYVPHFQVCFCLWCLGSFNPESFYFCVLFFFASPYVLSAQSQLLLAVFTGHFEVCRFLCLPAAWKIEFENSIQRFFVFYCPFLFVWYPEGKEKVLLYSLLWIMNVVSQWLNYMIIVSQQKSGWRFKTKFKSLCSVIIPWCFFRIGDIVTAA